MLLLVLPAGQLLRYCARHESTVTGRREMEGGWFREGLIFYPQSLCVCRFKQTEREMGEHSGDGNIP